MKTSVALVVGSIVECEADVIVNSANTDLIMGTGVAAAILHEAGPEVEEEAIRQGPLQVGDVVVTGPGNLAARHILHVAVVGDVPPDIEECTARVLERAVELGGAVDRLSGLGYRKRRSAGPGVRAVDVRGHRGSLPGRNLTRGNQDRALGRGTVSGLPAGNAAMPNLGRGRRMTPLVSRSISGARIEVERADSR